LELIPSSLCMISLNRILSWWPMMLMIMLAHFFCNYIDETAGMDLSPYSPWASSLPDPKKPTLIAVFYSIIGSYGRSHQRSAF
jgi:hypothetical protein